MERTEDDFAPKQGEWHGASQLTHHRTYWLNIGKMSGKEENNPQPNGYGNSKRLFPTFWRMMSFHFLVCLGNSLYPSTNIKIDM
jgi:hypothetical protein